MVSISKPYAKNGGLLVGLLNKGNSVGVDSGAYELSWIPGTLRRHLYSMAIMQQQPPSTSPIPPGYLAKVLKSISLPIEFIAARVFIVLISELTRCNAWKSPTVRI